MEEGTEGDMKEVRTKRRGKGGRERTFPFFVISALTLFHPLSIQAPPSSSVLLGPNTRQAFLGKARFGDSSSGQLIEVRSRSLFPPYLATSLIASSFPPSLPPFDLLQVSAQGSSKKEVQQLLAVGILEKLSPGQVGGSVGGREQGVGLSEIK